MDEPKFGKILARMISTISPGINLSRVIAIIKIQQLSKKKGMAIVFNFGQKSKFCSQQGTSTGFFVTSPI